MAFSADERLAIFEALELPPNASGWELWGVLGEANTVQHFQWTSPRDALDAAIALVEGAADAAAQEARVRTLLAEWEEVRTDVLELRSAEDVAGVVTSPSAKRELIKRRLLGYFPVYREGEAASMHGSYGATNVLRG